ncbi:MULTISPECIES: hypothetical protein [Paraburkholderia]|uniref:Uncharacterized protein n=3 Tax=Paraburkholderia TaxID=1822464 RepID=A0A1H7DX83_9BURK|nr:hypothetical protein [Paraburkholderia diazotrophica]CAB4052619.1 hypothetical protein LMG9964_06309 [Paraburkholderia phenoliruptrix]SEK06356.1 hypothetical protein SAMN05192539_103674 [Paraburkholderia diazotrophica]
MLLPMPRAEVDRVCLQVHVALDAMRRGSGNVNAAQTLCQVMILTGLLAEAGYGRRHSNRCGTLKALFPPLSIMVAISMYGHSTKKDFGNSP